MKKVIIFWIIWVGLIGTTYADMAIKNSDIAPFVTSSVSLGYGRCDVSYYGYDLAAFGNPATLAMVKSYFGTLIYNMETDSKENLYSLLGRSLRFENKRLGFVGFGHNGVMFYWKPLGEGKKEILQDNMKYIGNYDLSEYGLVLSEYDQEKNISYGATIKYFHGRNFLSEMQITDLEGSFADLKTSVNYANGYSCDIGLIFSQAYYSVGLSAINLFNKIYWENSPNTSMDSEIKWGISTFSKKASISFEHKINISRDVKDIYYSGISYQIIDNKKSLLSSLVLRYGLWGESLEDKDKRIQTLGVTLTASKYVIFDFAFEGENVNIFTNDNDKYLYQFQITLFQ